MVTGDHSQSDVVGDAERPGIDLAELLSEFNIAAAGSWDDPNSLKICPDMRAAQIYYLGLDEQRLKEITRALLCDSRVDQVLRRHKDRFEVTTRERGKLSFQREDSNPQARDRYRNGWSWKGQLKAVDGYLEDGELRFDDYPNALERIVGGLDHENSGDLWVTALPGYEFKTANTSLHTGGGSHGSLHRLDSLSPLIIGGVEADFPLPERTRLVDVTPLCLKLLGLNSREIGASALKE